MNRPTKISKVWKPVMMAMLVATLAGHDAIQAQAASKDVAKDARAPAAKVQAPAARPPAAPQARAPSTDAVMADLYEKAKKEKELNIYSVVTADTFTKVIADFNKQFPDIKVNATRFGGNPLIEKLILEKKANIHYVDAVNWAGIAPVLAEFIPKQVVEKYTPSTAALYRDDVAIPGNAYPLWIYTSAACYNTKTTNAAEVKLLRSYQGWTHPVFRGRTVITAPIGGTSGTHVVKWWQDKELGEKWFTALAANKPNLVNSVNTTVQQVISGEYDIGLNCLADVANRSVKAGAPIAYVYQEEYAVATAAYTFIVTRAPHPNAAKLWQEWQLSDAGQKSFQNHGGGLTARKNWSSKPIDVAWFVPPTKIQPGGTRDDYRQVELDTPKAFEAFSRIFKWAR